MSLDLPVLSLRPDHRQDARLDRFGQRFPSLDNLRQVAILSVQMAKQAAKTLPPVLVRY